MTPALILLVLGTGILALLPVRRLAERTSDRRIVTAYFVALWLVLAISIAVPPVRRLAVPLALVLAIAPWLTLRQGLDRLLGRAAPGRRPPPRNVTPPDSRPSP